jgi:hypothetical protein
MTTEIFKDIIGYEGIYQISNLGNVKRLYKKNPNGIILKQIDNGAGYLKVGLSKNNKEKKLYVHRLLAQYFIDNPNNYPCINHINGIKNDNRIENLEWCTYSENEKHSHRVLGKVTNGIIRRKLKLEDIEIIKSLYNSGMTQRKIAEMYNVCGTTINLLLNNKTYIKHV